MIPVVGSSEMRRADAAAIRGGTPSLTLMENAAAALVEETLAAFSHWRRAVVVCGPGNNGGDGLAAARLLREAGVHVGVFSLRDPADYRGDAAVNFARADDRGIEITPLSGPGALRRLIRELDGADGAVDALFGTGLSRGLTGLAARVVSALAASEIPVVSADLPSGLSADSGAVPGPAVRAAVTVAFAAPKLCHVLPPARALCGRVVVRDIGISREILDAKSDRSRVRIPEPADLAAVLAPRRSDSHKGDFGRLAIVAGSAGKSGAAVLAARGALRAGAGLVTVFGIPAVRAAVLAALPEAMTEELPEENGAIAASAGEKLARSLRDFDAAVFGPGLTATDAVRRALRRALGVRIPAVLDADALNAFSGQPAAWKARRAPTVATPHPGEMGRLLSLSARQVQGDRLAAVVRLAKAARCVAVLKGEGTLIAAPSGPALVNPTGTPLLAAPGSGDVLSGVVGAFLAAGLAPRDAAWTAVYLHGAAGERLARRLGDAGLLARELADAIPEARREILAEARS
ncbi:MAG TPA: NAD(P)H-hydrate dehydratase [Thermoanaerobaculia bacterium]|nr:NAD(P)H-hydrate dehydratase [Thermoanaerobaculia bacterium]